MAMSINKVFISGRIKGKPYEVLERNRQFTRFQILLPRERNRHRGEPDAVLIEAVGRNGTRIQALKDGAFITLEGQLRSTGSGRRESTILIRLENFSINIPPAALEYEQDRARQNEEGEHRHPRKSKRRGRKNQRDDRDTQKAKTTDGQQETSPSGNIVDKPKEHATIPAEAPQSDEQTSEAPTNTPKESAEEKSTDSQEAEPVKEQESKAPEQLEGALEKASGPPEMPSIKSVADDSMKDDMPF
jgi:hypothetical protein